MRAIAVLESFDEGEDMPTLQPADGIQAAGAIQGAVQTEWTDDDEADPPRSSRERAADRVCMVAILSLLLLWLPSMGIGWFFLALQLWMFWQLIQIYVSTELLRTKYLLRAGLAALISIPYVLVILVYFNSLFLLIR